MKKTQLKSLREARQKTQREFLEDFWEILERISEGTPLGNAKRIIPGGIHRRLFEGIPGRMLSETPAGIPGKILESQEEL